jgi:hypothetical protein
VTSTKATSKQYHGYLRRQEIRTCLVAAICDPVKGFLGRCVLTWEIRHLSGQASRRKFEKFGICRNEVELEVEGIEEAALPLVL